MWDEKLNQKKNLLGKIFFKSFFLILIANVASAFPIFPPHSAYINCNTSPGFLGDDSNTSLGFAGGTALNVSWDGTKMVLNAAQTTGTFTSRVIDNSCIGIAKPWLNLRWTSTLPFGKEIPSTNETTASYTGKANSTLSANLIGLWRFNEAAAYNGVANEVVDSSGNGNHGTLKTWVARTNTKAAGLFNNSWVGSDALPYGVPGASLGATTVLTLSIWYKASTNPGGFVQLAQRDNFAGNHWRIQHPSSNQVGLTIQTSGGTGGLTHGAASIVNGAWRHVVLTLNSGASALWVDGTKVTGTYPAGAGFVASELLVNNGPTGTYDEVAYWHRALSDAEILEIYRRGINRVKIQVRNCTSATCADNPAWQGPDGTATTWFTEINNNSNQLTGLGTPQAGLPTMLFTNFAAILRSTRYMQYKFVLETDNTTYMPNVNVVGPGR